MCGKIIVSNSEASTMERDELLRLIDKAADEQWTELDLAGMDLTELPPEIGKLTQLEKLILGKYDDEILEPIGNEITDLPLQIAKLTNLTHLEISGSLIAGIPLVITKLTNLTHLNLSYNQITDIPAEITKLTNLTHLNLSYNQITDIPAEIANLAQLIELNLHSNQISEIPETFNELINLKVLFVGSNEIIEIPKEIFKLTWLKSIYLHDNKITKIPAGIAKLTNLETLTISNNKIRRIPVAIAKLRNLNVLFLSENRIAEVPAAIAKLTKINVLYLHENRITKIHADIAKLTNLTILNLSNNQLKEIPSGISELKKLVELNLSDNQIIEIPSSFHSPFHLFENLAILDLRQNLIPIPREILNDPRDIQAILSFYFQTQDPRKTEPLYEAKFIIVGEGEAGKTTLAKKLQNSDYEVDPKEDSTHGINIIRWEFIQPNGKPFRVNIWDFGGQEIYHATHQFFLTERSLYTLLIDNRRENPNFYYWLDIVRLLSDNSPVFIIKNEKQDRQCEFSEGQLRSEFDNLQNSVCTNLANNRGLTDIQQAIQTHITALPHISTPIPKTWAKIRTILEEYTRQQDYISIEEYYNLCTTIGLEDRQEMLRISKYLNDLGICLHFQKDPVLKHRVILNPTWATNAVYRVTDTEAVKANNGCFTTTDLATIWGDAQYAQMHDELLRLMQNFGICYPIRNLAHTYIAPSLLSLTQPDYAWNETENLILRYEYEFMPRGILTRFIVEMHNLIESCPEPAPPTSQLVWKNGVILTDSRARAEVIEYYHKNEIRIRVAGFQKKTLLEHIRREFQKIHDSYERLKYQEFIPCNCSKCDSTQTPHAYPLAVLWKFLADRQFEIQCQKSYTMVNVRRLIDEVIEPIREDLQKKSHTVENKLITPTIYINNVENMAGNTTPNIGGDYVRGDKIMGDKVMRDKIGTQINNAPNLAQAALEIQALLDNLSETYNPNTETGQTKIAKDAIEQIEQNPTLKARIVNAIKESSYTALEEAIDRPVVKILIAAFKGFTEGK
jgi:internalin A